MKKQWLAIFAIAGMLVACNNGGSEEPSNDAGQEVMDESAQMDADHADHADDAASDMAEEVEDVVEEAVDEAAAEAEAANDEAMDAMESSMESGEVDKSGTASRR